MKSCTVRRILWLTLSLVLLLAQSPSAGAAEAEKAKKPSKAAKKASKEAKKPPKAAKKPSKTTEANVASFSTPEQTVATLAAERKEHFSELEAAGATDYSGHAEREVDTGMEALVLQQARERKEQMLIERVATSLQEGADIRARDSQGRTLLHAAVAGGYPRLADYLVTRGADLTARDADNRTPLDLARELDDEEMANLLESLALEH